MTELVELCKSALDWEMTEEEIEKAKELPKNVLNAVKGALNILKKYKDDLPGELAGAVKTLAKYASYGYPEKKAEDDEELEKAGKKLSKDTVTKLQSIAKAILELLPEEDRVIKTEEVDPVAAAVAKLEDIIQKLEGEGEKKEDDDEPKDDDLSKQIEEMGKRLEVVEKSKGVKKSIDSDGEDKELEKDKDGFRWSFLDPVLGE